MKKIAILFSAVSILALGACNNTGDKAGEDSAASKFSTEEPAKPGVLSLEGNDNMKYDKTEMRVKAGETVTLTFTNVGKAPKEAMGHNFVLLQQGVDMMAFDAEALKAKDNDYIPKDSKDIIAHTKLLGPGEAETITFTAPAAGTYTYLCTFPGHAMSMNGKLIVE